jgi:membrane-bound metal-dependent hydrolase YbcI (DUF457 family)
MLVGHGLLAFAAVASLGAAAGWDRRRALAVGVVALAFATLPDVDMLYAVWGGIGSALSGPLAANDAFWDATHAAHRSATHSLTLAVPTALAATLLVGRRPASGGAGWLPALAVLAGLPAVAVLASGPLDGATVLAFSVGALCLSVAIRRRTDLDGHTVGLAALAGLVSHPFGDLFTGTPPDLLYPLGVTVLEGKVLLSVDPTLNLLAVFALELVAVWLAAATYLRLDGRSLRSLVAPRAGIAAGYAGAVFLLPAPTLEAPTAFVVTTLAVGLALAAPSALGRNGGRLVADGGTDGGATGRHGAVLSALATGTAAVTVAWAAYLAVYALA